MIPILSSLIVQKGKISAKKAFFLSLVYVLGMSIAYTFAGILVSLFGKNISAYLQNEVSLIIFSLLFVVLALSMFDLYEIKLPSKMLNAIDVTSQKAASKGGIVGIFIMGALSALIVGPCVAPPLAGALAYIGQSGDTFLGGGALFSMGLGMGVPLLIVGTGAAKIMPKPGIWMVGVMRVFGFIMLGIAIWMLKRVFEGQIYILFWSFWFIGVCAYLNSVKWNKWIFVKNYISLVSGIFGFLPFVGAIGGAKDIFNPLEPFVYYEKKISIYKSSFKNISTIKELNKAIKESKNKTVLIEFYAKWCESCNRLKKDVFNNPDIKEKLKNFELFEVDITEIDSQKEKLMKSFGIFGPPAIVFLKNQKELKKIIGYVTKKNFENILKTLNTREKL
jgi:thiol:disulfide interchange protein DsbD